MTVNPFDAVVTKLSTGHDALIQVCGDSTGQGYINSSTGLDAQNGWAGRLGIKLATELNVNFNYRGATFPGFPIWTGYNINTTPYTSNNNFAPTLNMINGSMGGAQTTNLVYWINSANLIPDPQPDVVLIACGFNDVTQRANLLTRMQALITAVRSRCATAPIVITTQNRSSGAYTTTFLAPYSELTNHYVGQSLNLSPPLKAAAANVWVLDTQQAYTANPLSDWMGEPSTVHPNILGYQAQADWMYGQFPSPTQPPPVITTTTLGPVVRATAFSQSLTPIGNGLTWSIISGALPAGLFLDSATGIIAGTPTEFGGTYNFTVRATNEYGSDDQAFTGTIISNTIPFIPTKEARFRQRAIGIYYPIAHKMKLSGSFRPVIVRD